MLKVLLVDDEPFIIQGLKVIIDWENEGFEIAGMVSNGKEALQFLENENVDLVIADIRMPEMTGLELLETLRKDKKSDVYFVILRVMQILAMRSRLCRMTVRITY